MQVIKDIEQGTKEWFDLRVGKVTSSKFKDVMSKGRGDAPSKTRETYLWQVLSEQFTGDPATTFKSDAMERGNILEAQARKYYEFQEDVDVEQVTTIMHDNGLVSSSPDGLVGDKGMLEIKCPLPHTQLRRYRDGKFPSAYMAQVQGQMWIAERDWCDFISYCPDIIHVHPKSSYFKIRVSRDDAYIKNLADGVDRFLADIESEKKAIKEAKKCKAK